LAKAVVHEDYGWFTPDDLDRVVGAIHKLHDWKRIVLVGGQSLTAWVQNYKIPLPPIEGPYLTADADFLASRSDAELIARYLRGSFKIPDADDSTVNTATVDFTGSRGELIHIDLLWAVLGLDDNDINRLAVPISVGKWQITVLHPLLVLESRCVNLEKLSEKRHANGITQARVACLVVQKYLEECLADPARRREALDAAKRIAALAQSGAGVFVYHQWQIDVLGVIDPSKMPGQFARSWHFEVEKTQRKREIAARLSGGAPLPRSS
jgi:hypothetical protein